MSLENPRRHAIMRINPVQLVVTTVVLNTQYDLDAEDYAFFVKSEEMILRQISVHQINDEAAAKDITVSVEINGRSFSTDLTLSSDFPTILKPIHLPVSGAAAYNFQAYTMADLEVALPVQIGFTTLVLHAKMTVAPGTNQKMTISAEYES